MIPFLLELARESGCRDIDGLGEVMSEIKPGSPSPVSKILDSNLVEEGIFLRKLGERFSLSLWDGVTIKDEEMRRELRSAVPADIASRHQVLPVGFLESASGERVLQLATDDPFALARHSLVVRNLKNSVNWMIAPRLAVAEGLNDLYGVGAGRFIEILQNRGAEREISEDMMIGEETMILDDGGDDEASVIAFVNQIIRGALEQRATDIHLEPHDRNLRIRYRVDGVLQEIPAPDGIGSLQASVISRIKIMARLDIAEKRLPQDGRIRMTLDGNQIDVRVATIPSVEGESVSLRLLGQETFSLDRLGLSPSLHQTINQLLELPNGIILVTGPTGSGKSTSLYAFLSQINTPGRRIVTIEDPVENKLRGVVQIAVKPDIGLTFAKGLRSVLRGDPNVIMVGEMRDLETAEIAIRSALTGHLVFSTLHTNDAISGVTRLVDMGVEPFLVSSSVRAFVAQRLVRKLCMKCREPRPADVEALRRLGVSVGGNAQTYVPKGCPACRGIGYHGRLAIFEICIVTEDMQELIARGAGTAELQQQAHRDGFVPMRRYGLEKALAGETTIEEVLSATLTGKQFAPTPLVAGP